MQLWRHLWGPAIASAVLILVDPHAARAESDVPVPPNGLLANTGKGEITAADEDFVVRVRLAGLWEIPAGEMAEEKSANPQIREIGADIAAQHRTLDALTRTAAKKLDIKLPAKPNSDQQGWLGEMRDAPAGTEFDEIYIDRLRAAHGKIFPAIATIRASTRNDTVRKLAQQANQFVMTHMTLLESSGIVNFKALPKAPNPSAATSQPAATGQLVSSAAASRQAGTNTPLLFATLAAGLALGILATRHFLGRSRRGYRARRHR
jgi:putative membrane protein